MDQTARSVRASSARGGDFKVPNTVSADIQNRACWRSHFLSEIGTKAPWRSLRFRPPGRERRTCWPAVREARWRGREEERDGCREGGREEREGGREGGRKGNRGEGGMDGEKDDEEEGGEERPDVLRAAPWLRRATLVCSAAESVPAYSVEYARTAGITGRERDGWESKRGLEGGREGGRALHSAGAAFQQREGRMGKQERAGGRDEREGGRRALHSAVAALLLIRVDCN